MEWHHSTRMFIILHYNMYTVYGLLAVIVSDYPHDGIDNIYTQMTVLMSLIWCRSGKLELVSYLIEKHQCNIQLTTNDGMTPLHVACM